MTTARLGEPYLAGIRMAIWHGRRPYPAPGEGISTSTISNTPGPPYRLTLAALIAPAPHVALPGRAGHIGLAT